MYFPRGQTEVIITGGGVMCLSSADHEERALPANYTICSKPDNREGCLLSACIVARVGECWGDSYIWCELVQHPFIHPSK